MAFEFLTSFVTGNAYPGEEHRRLVERVNTVASVEQAGDRPGLLRGLGAFRTELAGHFAAEENELAKLPLSEARFSRQASRGDDRGS